jgi:hypothetical protein
MDDNLVKAGTENFNLPHDVVKLPSGGKFYKNNKKSVKVGYLTASDENMLINALQNMIIIVLGLLIVLAKKIIKAFGSFHFTLL